MAFNVAVDVGRELEDSSSSRIAGIPGPGSGPVFPRLEPLWPMIGLISVVEALLDLSKSPELDGEDTPSV